MTKPPDIPFTGRRVRWQGLVEAGLAAGLAGSWLGMGGRWFWLLDLFSHFRWQAVVVCLLAGVWALSPGKPWPDSQAATGQGSD